MQRVILTSQHFAQEWLFSSARAVYLNSAGARPAIFLPIQHPARRMFTSSGNLGRSSRTRRCDSTLGKRGGNAGRHFHYKDDRFWEDQAARTPLEYVWRDIRVRGTAWPRTRNIFIRLGSSEACRRFRQSFTSVSFNPNDRKYRDHTQCRSIREVWRLGGAYFLCTLEAPFRVVGTL